MWDSAVVLEDREASAGVEKGTSAGCGQGSEDPCPHRAAEAAVDQDLLKFWDRTSPHAPPETLYMVSTLFVVSPYLSNATWPVAPVNEVLAIAASTAARVGTEPPVDDALMASMMDHAA